MSIRKGRIRRTKEVQLFRVTASFDPPSNGVEALEPMVFVSKDFWMTIDEAIEAFELLSTAYPAVNFMVEER